MENLPVEVIGNILSRLGAARNVVIASATCRKWQEAWRNHLHTLKFNSNDWALYHEFSTSRLEILITQTIFQTKGLQCLSIIMDDVDEFSAAPVIAWLMYTRDTLRHLHYNVRTTPNINILEKCGRQKLEVLTLSHNSIIGVEPSYQKFPCLRSLSLNYVSISALDLSLLLTACLKIEVLTLVSLDIVMSDPQATMELATNSLKDIYVEAISLDKFILEADSLERLHLKDCTLEDFELIGKGTLRFLKIDDVSVIHLDIGENAENLEIVDVSNQQSSKIRAEYIITLKNGCPLFEMLDKQLTKPEREIERERLHLLLLLTNRFLTRSGLECRKRNNRVVPTKSK